MFLVDEQCVAEIRKRVLLNMLCFRSSYSAKVRLKFQLVSKYPRPPRSSMACHDEHHVGPLDRSNDPQHLTVPAQLHGESVGAIFVIQ